MTANPKADPAHLLNEHLCLVNPGMIRTLIDHLMSADAVCGAGDGASSPEQANIRNGCRRRPSDSRDGVIAMGIPSCTQACTLPG